MLGLLPIHNCLQVSQENEKLQRKIKNLKIINENLISQLNEYGRDEPNANVYSKKKVDTATQTDYDSELFNSNQNYEKLYNRLQESQELLVKRYQQEIKSNKENTQRISSLESELKQLNSRIKIYEKEKLDLMQSLNSLEMNTKVKLEMDLKKYKSKYRRCKAELKCFDVEFFDEIEDLKYYLDEAVKLNKYYEGLLHINTDKHKDILNFHDRLNIIHKSIDVKRSNLFGRKSFDSDSSFIRNEIRNADEPMVSLLYDSDDEFSK